LGDVWVEDNLVEGGPYVASRELGTLRISRMKDALKRVWGPEIVVEDSMSSLLGLGMVAVTWTTGQMA
jgi:hypothetical protein